MKEPEPADAVKEAIRQNIDRIGTPSPGHTDEEGNLKPEFEIDEIRNKYGVTVGFAKQRNFPDLAEEARRRLLEAYPQYADVIRDLENKDDND